MAMAREDIKPGDLVTIRDGSSIFVVLAAHSYGVSLLHTVTLRNYPADRNLFIKPEAIRKVNDT